MDRAYKAGDVGLLVEEDGHAWLVDIKETFGGSCRAYLIDLEKNSSNGLYKVNMGRLSKVVLSEVERKLFDVNYYEITRLRPDNVDFESVGHWQNSMRWLEEAKKK